AEQQKKFVVREAERVQAIRQARAERIQARASAQPTPNGISVQPGACVFRNPETP
ncbi:unnamed protein product, partial [Amoebophrya sp. A25]